MANLAKHLSSLLKHQTIFIIEILVDSIKLDSVVVMVPAVLEGDLTKLNV